MISKLKLKLLGIIIFILTILNNYLISNYNKEVFKMATKKTIKAATIKETKNLSTPTPVTNTNFDWKNFPYFTGAGQDLKFRATFGTLSSGFDLGFTNPWVFDYPVSFGFDAYSRSHKRELSRTGIYSSRSLSG